MSFFNNVCFNFSNFSDNIDFLTLFVKIKVYFSTSLFIQFISVITYVFFLNEAIQLVHISKVQIQNKIYRRADNINNIGKDLPINSCRNKSIGYSYIDDKLKIIDLEFENNEFFRHFNNNIIIFLEYEKYL